MSTNEKPLPWTPNDWEGFFGFAMNGNTSQEPRMPPSDTSIREETEKAFIILRTHAERAYTQQTPPRVIAEGGHGMSHIWVFLALRAMIMRSVWSFDHTRQALSQAKVTLPELHIELRLLDKFLNHFCRTSGSDCSVQRQIEWFKVHAIKLPYGPTLTALMNIYAEFRRHR